ncbi:MAG: hypothetical protein AAGK10_09930 [Cyanobacteria bacterium J06555_3]
MSFYGMCPSDPVYFLGAISLVLGQKLRRAPSETTQMPYTQKTSAVILIQCLKRLILWCVMI